MAKTKPPLKNNSITKGSDYASMLLGIISLLSDARKNTIRSINSIMTSTYWFIGRHIVEYEQEGKERAKYGSELLKRISNDLTQSFGKGYSYRNLRTIRQFYLTFQNWQTVFAKSERNKIQTSSVGLNDKIIKSSTKLSWSHFIRLVSVKDEYERNFYLIETAENNWSVRELNRQINSALFERLVLSKDKNVVKELSEKGQMITDEKDLLKDPLILEFLNIKESHKYSENDLESEIIDNLGEFLLELGKGFSFVARQKRFTSGADHYFIDLVFYNRLLRCFVLIDLKIGKLKHQDIGQMQMYVNYYDREIITKNEDPTIGIILCRDNDQFVIEYTLPKSNKQIFSREYKLYLPDKKELRKLLDKYL